MSNNIAELYRGFVIVPARGGFDVIHPLNGKWVWRPTERSARWWAGTWARVLEINQNPETKKKLPKKVKVVKVRKLKGLRTATTTTR